MQILKQQNGGILVSSCFQCYVKNLVLFRGKRFSTRLIVQGERGMNCSEMEECLCSLNWLFKHFTVTTLQNGPFTYFYISQLHVGHSNIQMFKRIQKKLGFGFQNMLDLSPLSTGRIPIYLTEESNLVVWSHLEFVSTDNLNIYAPTNISTNVTNMYKSYKQILDPLKTLLNLFPALGFFV